MSEYDKTEMNRFVQDLYDEKMREGKHGHYETMFHVVHKAIERCSGVVEGGDVSQKRILFLMAEYAYAVSAYQGRGPEVVKAHGDVVFALEMAGVPK